MTIHNLCALAVFIATSFVMNSCGSIKNDRGTDMETTAFTKPPFRKPPPIKRPPGKTTINCTCTFSNGISASYNGDNSVFACGMAVGRAGKAACAYENSMGRHGTLNLIGSTLCLSQFGKSHYVRC